MTDLDYRPLTPELGVVIHGIRIAELSPESKAQLYALWLRYKVLFIVGQNIDLDALIGFSRDFGDLMQLPYIKPHADYPHVIRVLKQADEIGMGVFGGEWHSDFSFIERPPQASILLAAEIPPVGGDTLWADMARACRHLPKRLRVPLTNRLALHAGAPYGVKFAPHESTQFKGSIEIERGNPEADREQRHPAICRHPETDQEYLFVNPTYTTAIEGMPADDSRELLTEIYRHCTRPEFTCRFKWRAGCIVLWDNRNTMHYAVNDYDGYRRCLYRTTIRGEAPLPV